MDPVSALREIAFLLERGRADSHRVKAFRRAADQLANMTCGLRDEHQANQNWAAMPGFGPKTIAVIDEALSGEVPEYLAKLRSEKKPLAVGGEQLREAIQGDLHVHSNWSDGTVELDEMMQTARELGHSWTAITDHSPSLKVAHGLSLERLQDQYQYIGDLNHFYNGAFRVLRGIEVDILADGALDQDADMLAALDVVVASVHSQLSMDAESMTHRMVSAIANPVVNVLGHCTGRLVEGERGTRPQSDFDAEVVFAACAQFNVAVEINSRPERCDPPDDLLAVAVDAGCLFAINTDAHAPGQLDFQAYGCARAEEAGITADRVVNTWDYDRLMDWRREKLYS